MRDPGKITQPLRYGAPCLKIEETKPETVLFMNFTLFQATKQVQVRDRDLTHVLMPEGPAFYTRQEAEQWLSKSELGPEYSVTEVHPFTSGFGG